MVYIVTMQKIAKLFTNGRSQAVRLPKEFRFPGDRVRISKSENGVLLQPLVFDTKAWFAELDRFNGEEPFMPEGREQPMPRKRDSFK
jgi:antitoxin VapB